MDIEDLIRKNKDLLQKKEEDRDKKSIQEKQNQQRAKKFREIKESLRHPFEYGNYERGRDYNKSLLRSYLNQKLNRARHIHVPDADLGYTINIAHDLMRYFEERGGVFGENPVLRKDLAQFRKENPDDFKKYEKALAKRIFREAEYRLGKGLTTDEDLLNYAKKILNKKDNHSGLENKTLTAIFSGASVLIALFFLSPNLTGNVIGALAQQNSNVFGIILFILGLAGLLISLKY